MKLFQFGLIFPFTPLTHAFQCNRFFFLFHATQDTRGVVIGGLEGSWGGCPHTQLPVITNSLDRRG